MGIAARQGGGVYVGYGSGYPTFTSVNLWRVGSSAPAIRIGARSASDVNVTPSSEGRLWLMWHTSSRLYFARTNKAATRVGKLRVIAPPSGTSTIWKLNGEGSRGPLDAFASVSTSGSLATWHQQVLQALELKATGGKKKATFSVTDAGDPVAGAKVTVGGKTLTTNAAGKATAKLRKGPYGARATMAGYVTASARVRVR
jgi:hypothetical protein